MDGKAPATIFIREKTKQQMIQNHQAVQILAKTIDKSKLQRLMSCSFI
jgi:hypothetical protein